MGNLLLCDEDAAGKRGGGVRVRMGYKSGAVTLVSDVGPVISAPTPPQL